MAKLQIPIDDTLMTAAKMFALQNNTTLKDVVTKALQDYLETEPTEKKPKSAPKKKEKPAPAPKKQKEPEPTPPHERKFDTGLIQKDHYLLRKPYYELRPETQHTRKTNFVVEWWLEAGDTQYMDEDQKIIPFRYRKADGTDYTPNEAEMKLLEEAYEKPVILEE